MDRHTKPSVTVCITAYNQGEYLPEAIESVLGQRYRDTEVFVVDDASTDNTQSVASEYQKSLTLVRNEKNLGLAGGWNRAIALGHAPYVALLHGDDFYLPDMLTHSIQILEEHARVGFVYGAYHAVDHKGRRLDLVQPFPTHHVWSGQEEFRHHVRNNYVQCPTVVVRRECYERLGPFNAHFVYALDWEMWLRIESNGYEVGYLADPTACWRRHPSTTTSNLERRRVSLVKDEIDVLNYTFDNLPCESHALRDLKRIAFYSLTKKYLLHALFQSRASDWAIAWKSLQAAWLAYRSGADIGVAPYLFRTGLRFVSRKYGGHGSRSG